jgi:nucleoside-diphosphate-sugar epimerase
MSRERVVIVGTGWAGFQLSQKLDDKKFDIVVVSPEETSPYTPLLVGHAQNVSFVNLRGPRNTADMNQSLGQRCLRSFRFLTGRRTGSS